VASILGFGTYLPERVVTHEALAADLSVEPAWILEACGIRERRYAAPDESVVDLAERAARRCLEASALDAGRLGGILVGTGTPGRRFPGVSADLQRRLGTSAIPAFDIHLASSGGFIALCLAAELCGRLGPILVVGAERMSGVVAQNMVKETAILFGDGAGAAVISPDPGPLTIVDWSWASDGTFADDLALSWDGALTMNGRAVIMQASRKLTGAVKALLDKNGRRVEEIDLFLFHQANAHLLRQLGKTLGIEDARLFMNLERYGNTSAASVLIAAAEAREHGRLRPRASAVMAAFGAGFTYGAMLLAGR
jgi:3-oxoacyl-[acyl-carrier-protein] synthase-3